MRIIKSMEEKYLASSLELLEAAFTDWADAQEGKLVCSLVKEIRSMNTYIPKLELIMVARASITGAAVPALPVTDTIKEGENGETVGTVDRSRLWAVQTPQVFEAGLIRAALEKAIADGENLTDDCAAVERLGMRVSLTKGSKENIKITTPFDLMLGVTILEARARGEL